MEARELAIKILSADNLNDKLSAPDLITDHNPGPLLIWDQPTRPTGMGFCKHHRKNKLPSSQELSEPDKRAVYLHRFAGHELLAVEIMAYALLAFPFASANFRKGLIQTLKDEQEHVKLYIKELNRLNTQFGDLPLYKHFWAYTPYMKSPLEYVSIMSLTFEMANLDFAPYYGKLFYEHGDIDAYNLMKKILKDELRHVRFGYRYLIKSCPTSEQNIHIWEDLLPPLMQPKQAKGPDFQVNNRKKAGLSSFWIEAHKAY